MSVKRKRRPRRYRSELRDAAVDVTRTRIMQASRRLLTGGKDLPAFSLDAVAREAGVTRLTVYNQFESKRGLLEAVFDDIAERGGLFDDPAPPIGVLSVQLAFRVAPGEVSTCASTLRDRGVAIVSGPTDRPFGHRTLFFRDPDGNVLEIYAEI